MTGKQKLFVVENKKNSEQAPLLLHKILKKDLCKHCNHNVEKTCTNFKTVERAPANTDLCNCQMVSIFEDRNDLFIFGVINKTTIFHLKNTTSSTFSSKK